MAIHQNEIEEDKESMAIDDNGEILDSGSNCGDSNSAVSDQFGVFTGKGMFRLPEGNVEREVVKSSFVAGMGCAGRDMNIVAIHKSIPTFDLTTKVRFQSFKIFCRAVAQKNGGNHNMRYAWYGGSKEELSQIVLHGFSRCTETATAAAAPNGQSYGGVGVHMIPLMFSCDGAMSSDVDESGLKHVLLCRVVLGKTEMVACGSRQWHPSSVEFDTGVDNLINPRRYIVWIGIMNSHIFPCFLVSFKAPNNLNVVPGIRPIFPSVQPIPPGFQVTQHIQNAFRATQQSALRPASQWLSFSTLMSLLSKFLPRPKMEMLKKVGCDMGANKITRQQAIQRMRQIAGGQLLVAVLLDFKIKKMALMGVPATAEPNV